MNVMTCWHSRCCLEIYLPFQFISHSESSARRIIFGSSSQRLIFLIIVLFVRTNTLTRDFCFITTFRFYKILWCCISIPLSNKSSMLSLLLLLWATNLGISFEIYVFSKWNGISYDSPKLYFRNTKIDHLRMFCNIRLRAFSIYLVKILLLYSVECVI